MAPEKPSIKEYLDEENRVIFACPACNKKKAMRISTEKEIRPTPFLCCRCICGHPFNVILERRKHPRKQVNFPGRYMSLLRDQHGDVTILDISRAGLQLEFKMPLILEKGTLIFVEFELDDKHRSLIQREVEICSVNGKRMGGNFTSEEQQDPLREYLEQHGLITEKDMQVLVDYSELAPECKGRPWDELLSTFS